MLWIGNKRVAKIWVGSKPVATLYLGAVKIWEAIGSCFGSGRWLPEKPWKGGDRWKNF